MIFKAVLVDDEPFANKSLEILLAKFCPQVKVVAVFNNPLLALDYLNQNEVDILFLDIDMPFLSGFELLAKIERTNFKIIFVTAYDQFALKAFRYSAFDYLLKPIEEELLVQTIQKIERNEAHLSNQNSVNHLLELLNNKNQEFKRIALPTLEGFEFVEIDNIIHCESDSNYTKVFFANHPMFVVSRTLKVIESMLLDFNFIRIHNSHLINIKHVKKYIKADGGFLQMVNNRELPISRAKKDEVLKKLNC